MANDVKWKISVSKNPMTKGYDAFKSERRYMMPHQCGQASFITSWSWSEEEVKMGSKTLYTLHQNEDLIGIVG